MPKLKDFIYYAIMLLAILAALYNGRIANERGVRLDDVNFIFRDLADSPDYNATPTYIKTGLEKFF